MIMNRRRFLLHLGALSAGATCSQLGSFAVQAATTPGDYKALVCVFLFGGNDGNNTIVPIDSTGYQNYSTLRGGPPTTTGGGGIALPQASLVPLVEQNGTARFGLHPDLAALKPIWDQGRLAALFNVGTLMQPLTKADYASATTLKPVSLFSHSDQQAQWQSARSTGPSASGWGGRIADQLASLNMNAGLAAPAMISTTGPHLFVAGNTASALAIPDSGMFGLRGFDNSAASMARRRALDNLLLVDRGSSTLVDAAQDVIDSAIANSAALNPILTTSSLTPTSISAFAGLNTDIASQLLAVSKLIERRADLNLRRQVFFVSFGSFDHHQNQLEKQSVLLAQLGPALKAFHDSLTTMGAINDVTTFTLSDFARALQPNTNGGTDHAWGNHHLIMGGAVKGKAFYGTFPTLALNGPDDATNLGRWIPTTAVDQYAATLATWFGVSPSGLATVLPNLASFPTSNLQFMNA